MMAIRVRKDGTMVCAALTESKDGDTYIDDALHHIMHQEYKVIYSKPMPEHLSDPRWFWTERGDK